ncbi:hypothetical protein LI139_08830 [Veillonella atypica]|uniref:hypothetical protein n=1 Tax=Veillonella TaxID=29465 RepID=UPI001D093A6D|nr:MULTISPECIES: hypothetical protein [Veillonella]MCB6515752.1 hypothetical protein [Veillonella atypica]MCG4863400.1 hypothetical protein [Veillonella atypica]MDU6631996.1 hypothetical protein [Veillonella sp.]
MDFEVLKKELAEHKVYTAWQFIENTNANIRVAWYCLNTIAAVSDKMTEIAHKNNEEISEKIINHKSISITEADIPDFSIDIAGKDVDGFFLIQKLIRDFYQYLRNSFDSIGQIANAGLLANKGKKVDGTDFPAMRGKFLQQTYSGEYPLTSAWFSKTDGDEEFKYIDAVCNRVKHTAFINNQVSIGLFGCENKMNMGAFLRKGEQHEKANLKDKMQQAIKYTEDSYAEFLAAFSAEFKNDLHISGRYHEGIKVYQQYMKDSELSSFSLSYIVSKQPFSEMPDEIYILLLRNNEDEIKAADSPFTTILITSKDDYKTAIGRYVAAADDAVGKDNIVKYRKYVKDTDTTDPQIALTKSMRDGTGKFYHANLFFDLQTVSVSDDDTFLKRTALPF